MARWPHRAGVAPDWLTSVSCTSADLRAPWPPGSLLVVGSVVRDAASWKRASRIARRPSILLIVASPPDRRVRDGILLAGLAAAVMPPRRSLVRRNDRGPPSVFEVVRTR